MENANLDGRESTVWDSLSDIEKQALAECMGGGEEQEPVTLSEEWQPKGRSRKKKWHKEDHIKRHEYNIEPLTKREDNSGEHKGRGIVPKQLKYKLPTWLVALEHQAEQVVEVERDAELAL